MLPGLPVEMADRRIWWVKSIVRRSCIQSFYLIQYITGINLAILACIPERTTAFFLSSHEMRSNFPSLFLPARFIGYKIYTLLYTYCIAVAPLAHSPPNCMGCCTRPPPKSVCRSSHIHPSHSMDRRRNRSLL